MIGAPNDNLYDDEAVLASLPDDDVVPPLHHIDAAEFGAVAQRAAIRGFGALVTAVEGESLWVHVDGTFVVGEKPRIEFVTSAPVADYDCREDVFHVLVRRARPCIGCAKSVAEHSDVMRVRYASGACAEYNAGLALAVA